jgi:hypothetical protein
MCGVNQTAHTRNIYTHITKKLTNTNNWYVLHTQRQSATEHGKWGVLICEIGGWVARICLNFQSTGDSVDLLKCSVLHHSTITPF